MLKKHASMIEMFTFLFKRKKATVSFSLICVMILSIILGTPAAFALPGFTTTFNGTLDTAHTYIKPKMPAPFTAIITSGFTAGTDTGAAGTTDVRNYYVLPFTPTVSGDYNIELTAATLTGINPNYPNNSAATDDTFIFLYQGIFDPLKPLNHLVAGHDDISGTIKRSAFSNMNLQTNTYYSLVVSSFYVNATGSFTFSFVGPGEVQGATPSADLNSLTLSQGTLAEGFNSGTTSYTSSVANSVYSVSVTAAVYQNPSTMQVRVNGGAYAPLTSGSPSSDLALNVGTNTIDVQVTAPDGTTVKTYTIALTREQSDNANLNALSLSQGTLSPAFASGTTSYTSSVANSVYSVSVTAAVYDNASTMQVRVNGGAYVPLTSGSTSGDLALNVGANTIDVQVTAPNGTTVKTYTIALTREQLTAPVLNTAMAGDTQISLSWSPIAGATGYKIFKSTTSGDYGTEEATVSGSVYSYNVTGLTNGTTYYFVVLAANPGGDSAASNEVSATPWAVSVPNTPEQTPEPKVNLFISSIVNEAELVQTLISKAAGAKGADTAVDFADTQRHWAEETIDTFVRLNLINGYQDGTFRPDSPITRAEFASILNRVFQIHGGSTSKALKDIDGIWAKDDIENLVAAGVISGYPDDSFRPNQTITREEMVVMLSRIVNLNGLEKDRAKGQFNDLNGAYAASEITAAAQASIVSGKGNGSFDPKNNATRAEALQIILNVLKLNPELKTLLESLE